MKPATPDTPPAAGPAPDTPPGADFAAVIAQADAIEGGALANAPGAPAPAEDPNAASPEDILPLLELARAAAADDFAWWPQFGEAWSDKRLQSIAVASANALNHYGVSVGELVGHPLFGLAVAIVPPSFSTWAAVRQRRAELERQARARAAAAPAPGAAP